MNVQIISTDQYSINGLNFMLVVVNICCRSTEEEQNDNINWRPVRRFFPETQETVRSATDKMCSGNILIYIFCIFGYDEIFKKGKQ